MSGLIDYRLIYARLTRYSEESLVVGVLYKTEGGIGARFVDQRRLYDTFSTLVSLDWTEQLFFALRLQKESLEEESKDFSQISPSTSLVKFGRCSRALSEDIDGYLDDLLKVTAVSAGCHRIVYERRYETIGQKEIEEVLKNAIIRLNPLKGRELVKRQKVVLGKRNVELPFFGERLIGAPVSIHRVDPYDAVPNAEHWLLRLKHVKTLLDEGGIVRFPSLYLYSPNDEDLKRNSKIESISDQIQEIGSSIDVAVTRSPSIDGLAMAVYRDEKVVY